MIYISWYHALPVLMFRVQDGEAVLKSVLASSECTTLKQTVPGKQVIDVHLSMHLIG